MRYELTFDLAELFGAGSDIAAHVVPNLSYAVRQVASATAQRWRAQVNAAKLWSGEKDRYMESIQWEMKGPLEAEVWTEYALAKLIETGRPARDLKVMLTTSRKTRQSARGRRYLIIPFRHNIPTPSGRGALAPQMTPEVYADAKELAPSRILKPGSKRPRMRLSASKHWVPQASYHWGERLAPGYAPLSKPHHKTDRFAGMVRFDTSSGKQTSSSYVTFRAMAEGAEGWIVPAKPGLYLAKQTAEAIDPVFQAAVRAALTFDANRGSS